MGRIYDNWERLVTAVVRREQLRQIARNHSRNSSTISSGSSDDFDLSNESHFIDDQLPAATSDHTSDYEERTSTLQTQGFYVDEGTKKHHMLGAKELLILMRRTSQYWDWTADAGSRFSEVAVLHYGRCLDIRGRIKTQMLSSGTTYAAYLVFKLTEWSKGLESANAVVNIFRVESDRDAQKSDQIVHLQPGRNPMGPIALRRIDGWMEVEIGKFYVDVHDEAVEAQILELTSWKMGLTVEGIEFRPLYSEAKFDFPQPLKLYLGSLTDTDDSNDDNHEIKSRSSDLEKSPIFVINGDLEVRKARVVAETEKAEETEIDISLLQEFAPQSLAVRPDPSSRPPTSIVSPPLPPSAQSKQNNNNSLQDDGVGEEMMAKLLLPADEPLLASLTRDELFSSGYDCLSKVVYFFDGMKRMIELKDRESDDLKQKLLKNEVEAQLALAAKDCELEELKKIVNVLKSDIEKVQDNAREEVRKADERVKKAEREVENAEARAASAIENYKSSHDLKVDKHKFASKAFAIGFDLCKKQVLEVDPNFDFSHIDIKCLEA